MSFTLDPTQPLNAQSPRQGALRIRELTARVLQVLGFDGLTDKTLTLPPFKSVDLATGLAEVQADPTVALGIATKQYVDAASGVSGIASGTDTYVTTLTPAPAQLSDLSGRVAIVKIVNANTGPATINCNSFGATPIKKNVTEALEAGDIPAGFIAALAFDGTNFQLVSVGRDFVTEAEGDARYAKLAGLATQTFKVGAAIDPAHAVRFDQIVNSLGVSGYIGIPTSAGVLLIQWMPVTAVGSNSTKTQAWPTAFSTFYAVVGSRSSGDTTVARAWSINSTTTQVTVTNASGSGSFDFYVIGIGTQ